MLPGRHGGCKYAVQEFRCCMLLLMASLRFAITIRKQPADTQGEPVWKVVSANVRPLLVLVSRSQLSGHTHCCTSTNTTMSSARLRNRSPSRLAHDRRRRLQGGQPTLGTLCPDPRWCQAAGLDSIRRLAGTLVLQAPTMALSRLGPASRCTRPERVLSGSTDNTAGRVRLRKPGTVATSPSRLR